MQKTIFIIFAWAFAAAWVMYIVTAGLLATTSLLNGWYVLLSVPLMLTTLYYLTQVQSMPKDENK